MRNGDIYTHSNLGVPQSLETDTDIIVRVQVVKNVSEKAWHGDVVGAVRYRFDAMFSNELLHVTWLLQNAYIYLCMQIKYIIALPTHGYWTICTPAHVITRSTNGFPFLRVVAKRLSTQRQQR